MRSDRPDSSPPNFLSVLTGSFSTPAAGNPTVVMMEAAFSHAGLDARYINCEVPPELLGDAVRGARAMGWAGFNCSLPHKVRVISYLDRLAASAEIIGAVNCVVRREDHLVGENTDGQGFLLSLQIVIDPSDKVIVILGAGGAARAIAVETALAGASSIVVVNRDRSRGQELVDVINRRTSTAASFVSWTDSYVVPNEADILVNATPIGMFPDSHASPAIDPKSLRPDMVVADVIPNPPLTTLLLRARERGCTTLDGLGMLINQGAINIRHWTGIDADTAIMRQTLEELF